MNEPIISQQRDFEFHNNINICGKILFKRAIKNGNMFAISVSRRLKTSRINKETGKEEFFDYRMINVYFEGATGKYYDKLYEVGDFVVVNAVAQKTRNNYLARNMVKVIGLMMAPKLSNRYENRDKNYVSIRGRIDHANILNDNYIICDLYTNVHKKFKNPNTNNTEVPIFEDDFVSVTPIGINRPDGDAKEVIKELTKGTWLDITGYVDIRKFNLHDGRTITETRIVAQEVYLIGQSQKAQ